MKIKPPVPPFVITMAQISQMVVGVAVQSFASYKYFTDPGCAVNGRNIFWGGAMYLSYFALFTKFAIDRYAAKKEKKVA